MHTRECVNDNRGLGYEIGSSYLYSSEFCTTLEVAGTVFETHDWPGFQVAGTNWQDAAATPASSLTSGMIEGTYKQGSFSGLQVRRVLRPGTNREASQIGKWTSGSPAARSSCMARSPFQPPTLSIARFAMDKSTSTRCSRPLDFVFLPQQQHWIPRQRYSVVILSSRQK